MGTPVRLRAEGSMNTTALMRAGVDFAVAARHTGGVEHGVRQRLIRRVCSGDPHQSTMKIMHDNVAASTGFFV